MTPITRLRYLIAKRGSTIAIVLLALGLLSLAGSGWAYANPPTTEITDHTDQRTVTANLATSGTVTGDSAIYESGAVLRNQPVYLQNATPVANLSVTTSFDGGSGTASHRFTLVYTAARDGEAFWKRTMPLATTTAQKNGTAITTTSLSIAEIRSHLRTYRAEFGRAGSVTVSIRLSVDYAVEDHTGTFTETYPVSVGDGWYALQSDTLAETHSTPVTRVRTLPPDSRISFQLSTTFAVVFLLIGAAATFARRRIDETERELTDAIHRARYDEWVSPGAFPPADSESVVRMESLEALVDVAIDSRKRVIHDSSSNQYAVLDGEVQYRYTPYADSGQ